MSQSYSTRIVEVMRLQPLISRLMKIIKRPLERMPCIMADDADLYAKLSASNEKIHYAGKRFGLVHARAIDATLHLRPRFLTTLLSQVVGHVLFSGTT